MKFIVLEGIDGSGLSTQSRLIAEYLTKKGKKVLLTKEPTNGEIGKIIRKILNKEIYTDEVTLSLLFAADRMDHISKINFNDYDYVISDRYYFSNFAYQLSKKIDLNFLININKFAPKPDVVIFLDVNPEICLKRIKERANKNSKHIEIYENIEKLKEIRKNFFEIFEKFKDIKILKINGEEKIENVNKEILKALNFE
ncbi:MAG: dTMP kinase [Candidatus Altarchaeaceae archaeon]